MNKKGPRHTLPSTDSRRSAAHRCRIPVPESARPSGTSPLGGTGERRAKLVHFCTTLVDSGVWRTNLVHFCTTSVDSGVWRANLVHFCTIFQSHASGCGESGAFLHHIGRLRRLARESGAFLHHIGRLRHLARESGAYLHHMGSTFIKASHSGSIRQRPDIPTSHPRQASYADIPHRHPPPASLAGIRR